MSKRDREENALIEHRMGIISALIEMLGHYVAEVVDLLDGSFPK
jgi:hypothetical protein